MGSLAQRADNHVLGPHDFGLRDLTRLEHLGFDVDSRLLVVTNRDFDLGLLGQVFGERIDPAHPEFHVTGIGGRAALDDSQVDTALIVGDRAVDLRHRRGQRCVGRQDVVRHARLRFGVADQHPQCPRRCTVLLELLQSGRRRRVEDRLREGAVRQQHPRVIGRSMRDRLVGREGRVQRPTAEPLEQRANHRHPRRTARRQHDVDFRPAHVVFLEQIERQRFTAIDQILRQPLELFEFHLIGLPLSPGRAREGRLGANRQAALGLLRFEGQCLRTLAVLRRIDRELFLELLADRHF